MEQLVSIFSLSLTEMIACLIHFCTTSQTMRNWGRKVIQGSTWSPRISRLIEMNLPQVSDEGCVKMSSFSGPALSSVQGEPLQVITVDCWHPRTVSGLSSTPHIPMLLGLQLLNQMPKLFLRDGKKSVLTVKRLMYCLLRGLKQMMNEIRDEFALILICYL